MVSITESLIKASHFPQLQLLCALIIVILGARNFFVLHHQFSYTKTTQLSYLAAIWTFSRLGAPMPNQLGGTRGHPGRPLKTAIGNTHLSTIPKAISLIGL